MEYIFIYCWDSNEKREIIYDLKKSLGNFVIKKYQDQIILLGNVKIKIFTNQEVGMGKTKVYRPYCVLEYYEPKILIDKIVEIYKSKEELGVKNNGKSNKNV